MAEEEKKKGLTKEISFAELAGDVISYKPKRVRAKEQIRDDDPYFRTIEPIGATGITMPPFSSVRAICSYSFLFIPIGYDHSPKLVKMSIIYQVCPHFWQNFGKNALFFHKNRHVLPIIR